MAKPKQGEIVIAINSPKNSPVWFPPANTKVQSVFMHFRSGPGVPPALTPISRIPGQRIHLDVKNKCGRISHTLRDEPNDRLIGQVKDVWARLFNQEVADPPDDSEFPNLTREQVNTWLFWMRRILNNGEAELIQGQLPDIVEIYGRDGGILNLSYDRRLGQHTHLVVPEYIREKLDQDKKSNKATVS